jgi:NTP pyrophosphatase (non-canonical NTP hydrolase)
VHDEHITAADRPAPADPQPEPLFAAIAAITAWLDGANPPGPHEDSMRVLKLVEEAGEAASAYIGMVGQNPRKGITHSLDDLLGELADVAITALCAIQHFTQDTATTHETIAAKLRRIVSRSDIRTGRAAT